jgi:hypothetical protein
MYMYVDAFETGAAAGVDFRQNYRTQASSGLHRGTPDEGLRKGLGNQVVRRDTRLIAQTMCRGLLMIADVRNNRGRRFRLVLRYR